MQECESLGLTTAGWIQTQKVEQLAIITTDKCPIRCAHCLMSSGPENSSVLSFSEISKAIDFFNAKHELQMVVFTGGESSLLGNDLFESIAYCYERNIPTRLVTNAIWADSVNNAVEFVSSLAESGLNEINLSTDDFHASWISLDNIKNAWNACKGRGFASVLCATCSGPRSHITPESLRDFLNEDILIIDDVEKTCDFPTAEDGTFYAISSTSVARLGRGRHLRNDYFYPLKTTEKIYGGCPGIGKPATLLPDGSVGVCCGINTQNNPILSLNRFDDANDLHRFQLLILEALKVLGPVYLCHIASESSTFVSDNNIHSACEACELLTRSSDMLSALKDKEDIIIQQLNNAVCNVKLGIQ